LKTKAKERETQPVSVKPMNLVALEIPVRAMEMSPVVLNKFTTEAQEEMLKKQVEGKTKGNRELRVLAPELEAEARLHKTADGKIGFPTAGFLGGMIEVADAEDLYKKNVQCTITIIPDAVSTENTDLVLFRKFKEKKTVRDVVKLANGSPNIIHRPYIYGWEAVLRVQYDANRVTPDTVVNLISKAGFSIGIGAWRPYVKGGQGKPGTKGKYEVVPGKPR